MKIVLIQPPKPTYGAEAEKHWQLTRPLSLHFLAASLGKYTEHKVEIIDFEQRKYRKLSVEDVLADVDASIYGITATTYTRFEAIRVARVIKRYHPDQLVVAGGVHFMHTARETLEKVPQVDVVVRGEGELTIVELANAVSEGGDFEAINGVTYRKDQHIVDNPPQTKFIDPDVLPTYAKFTWDDYPEYLFGYPDRLRAISVMASRGCPYRCAFCAKSGSMYRLRNPVAVVDEIEFLMKKCDVEAVNFLDLSFTATPSHVGALCEEMMRRSLGLKWWCESRANTPLELLKVMKRAGCVSTVVGIESGSSRILSAITKGISLDQAIRFCKECAELGISVGPYFMYSLPGESKSDVVKTLDIINELERFTLGCSFQPAMIFPGTKLEKIAKAKGILPSDFSWCDPYESSLSIELGQLSNVPLFIDMLSAEDLRRLRKELPRMRRMRAQADHVAQMSVPHLIRKGLDVLIHRDHPSREYVLSPGFWREYIRKKLKAIFSPSKESPSDGLSS